MRQCVNDDSTSDAYGYIVLVGAYESNPGACGSYDDEDFTASKQCCACGGGLYGARSRRLQHPNDA